MAVGLVDEDFVMPLRCFDSGGVSVEVATSSTARKVSMTYLRNPYLFGVALVMIDHNLENRWTVEMRIFGGSLVESLVAQ